MPVRNRRFSCLGFVQPATCSSAKMTNTTAACEKPCWIAMSVDAAPVQI